MTHDNAPQLPGSPEIITTRSDDPLADNIVWQEARYFDREDVGKVDMGRSMTDVRPWSAWEVFVETGGEAIPPHVAAELAAAIAHASTDADRLNREVA